MGFCYPERLQWCWRNVYLNSAYLPSQSLDPLSYMLPREGQLQLDYVTYDLPATRFKHTLDIVHIRSRGGLPSAATQLQETARHKRQLTNTLLDTLLAATVQKLQDDVTRTKC